MAQKMDEEYRTPKVNLSNSDQPGSMDRAGSAKITARLGEKEVHEYFVGSEKTSLERVSDILLARGARVAELRLDDRLTNAVTVELLGECQEAGVEEIYYVFIRRK